MKKTAIIIPTRLGAKRFPNKPLAKINNIPMIIHVLNRAKESKVGEVFVASPDEEIIKVVKKNKGNAFLTKNDHSSGSDRIYEVYKKVLDDAVDLIINLQGDMPNIKPGSILKLEKLMRKNKCDIGTLASYIKKNDISNPNIVKVEVEKNLESHTFLEAKDFFRIKKDLKNKKIYHHVGIYCFQPAYLKQYIELGESKQEKIQKLEQLRVLGKIDIKVGYCDSNPLSVDTLEDLKRAERRIIGER